MTTGSGSGTTYVSDGRWKGALVPVESDQPCPVAGHALTVMHHCDDDGTHYCPTGFLWCAECAGTADEPEPMGCQKWGEK